MGKIMTNECQAKNCQWSQIVMWFDVTAAGVVTEAIMWPFYSNGDMCRMADPTFEPYGGVAPRWAGPCGDACAKNLEKFPA